MSAEAVRWSCARCEVSVGRINGEPTLLPSTWSRSDGQILCLVCSRAQAGDTAIDSAPEASSREELVRVRRAALIEFEIGRAPEAPNRTIALACRTSSATVAAVRSELERPAATAPPDLDAHRVA
jgi:hypothetical protein